MTDPKIIIITDPELGALDHEETTDVINRIDTVAPKDTDKQTIKDIGQEDILEYQKAWAEADIDELERLRLLHPEDARFNLHLSLAGVSAEEAQDFSEVNANHKELLKELGLTGAPEFLRLLEDGNHKKTKAYIESLPETNPLKKSMQILAKYL